MTGLCGWIGDPRAEGEARGLLTNCIARVPALSGSTDALFVGDTGALAARGASPSVLAGTRTLAAACVGELRWNDADLAAIAADRGDAEALLEAWRRHGFDLLERIRGAFTLAVLDLAANRALIAVDRLGRHGMCYAQRGTALLFGTTTDSIAAHPVTQASVSPQAIYNYLYCHMVPSPGTIYADVHKLLPGQCIRYNRGRIETPFYWSLHYEDRATSDYASYAGEFKSLLRECVGRSVNGEAIGAFLSGGTDSSTVTGVLTELRGPGVDTYSIGFEAEGFDEMEYARTTVRHFGAQAHEYYVTPQDVVDAVPKIAAAYDEPFGNASAVPTYYCAKAARENGKRSLLAGDGGDEIFGGNVRYAKQLLFEWYWAMPGGLRRGLIEPSLLGVPALSGVFPLSKVASYVRQARVPLPDRLETYNFLERGAVDEILEPDFLRRVDPAEPPQIARAAYERADSRSALNRMMHLDLKQTLADNDLRKVNRMCLLADIDVRYPLLDEALVEFSGRIPPSYKVRRMKLRWFFKEALKDFLPPATIAKSKHGFGLPFGLWLHRHPPLQELARESLRSLQQRGIVRASYVERLTALHRSDEATYYGVMIWVLMMLEQWLQAHRLPPSS